MSTFTSLNSTKLQPRRMSVAYIEGGRFDKRTSAIIELTQGDLVPNGVLITHVAHELCTNSTLIVSADKLVEVFEVTPWPSPLPAEHFVIGVYNSATNTLYYMAGNMDLSVKCMATLEIFLKQYNPMYKNITKVRTVGEIPIGLEMSGTDLSNVRLWDLLDLAGQHMGAFDGFHHLHLRWREILPNAEADVSVLTEHERYIGLNSVVAYSNTLGEILVHALNSELSAGTRVVAVALDVDHSDFAGDFPITSNMHTRIPEYGFSPISPNDRVAYSGDAHIADVTEFHYDICNGIVNGGPLVLLFVGVPAGNGFSLSRALDVCYVYSIAEEVACSLRSVLNSLNMDDTFYSISSFGELRDALIPLLGLGYRGVAFRRYPSPAVEFPQGFNAMIAHLWKFHIN